jgi:hypothetical protein
VLLLLGLMLARRVPIGAGILIDKIVADVMATRGIVESVSQADQRHHKLTEKNSASDNATGGKNPSHWSAPPYFCVADAPR